jgi:hypothetical protein
MSTIMQESTITVREFMGDKVNFIANDDLFGELLKGGNSNMGGDFYAGESRVLVTTNVDDCGYANVEVDAACSRGYVDAVEDAIESLIVVRDALRKMSTAA